MLGSVVALIGTAVVVGLIASGQLLGDEGIDVMAFADKHLTTNQFQIQNAFNPYPPAGYTPRPSNNKAQGTVESPQPSPSPAASGTPVQTMAIEGTPSDSNRPEDEPVVRIAGAQNLPSPSATAALGSEQPSGVSVTQVPGSVQPSGVSATPVPVSEQPPTESLEIASPVNEALLCSGFTIRGSASGLASGQLAMILLQSADGGRIYPQGPLIPNEDGTWQINVVGLRWGRDSP